MDHDLVASVRRVVSVDGDTVVLLELDAILEALKAKSYMLSHFHLCLKTCEGSQFHVGVRVAFDVHHQRGSGVGNQLRVSQLDQVNR